MSGTQPVAVYAMKVPPGDILVPAVADFAAMFRVSMAAIDPTAEPEYDDIDDKKPPRATLKLIRVSGYTSDDEDESEDEEEDDLQDEINGMDEDEDTSDEEDNGGPSDPAKAKKAKSLDIAKAIAEQEADEDGEDEDEDEEMSEDDAKAAAMLKRIMKGKGKNKGKGKASDDDENDDDEDLDSEDDLDMEEVVVCTLDPEKNYQQTLDFVVGEDERIFFKVTGTHTVHLTGNYVIPIDDGQAQLHDDEDDDYDLSPDEDELEVLEEEGVSDDELDDLADPRVVEADTDDGDNETPKLVAPAPDKGKNKRPAPASDDEEDGEDANLDDIMAKSLKPEQPAAAAKGEQKKLTKAERKKLKKLKKNDGEAAPATTPSTNSKTTEPKKEAATTNGERKVQFAKNLEQGPTPSATPPTKSDKKSETKGTDAKAKLGVKEVQGVTIDDRKLGSGPAAKKGDKIEMRYIGKLDNGKVFDANKKGKPFSFKLGAGEVIKGWDIGVTGMSVGGERRITVPAHHGYGSKGAPPDIPPNAKLIFDLKLLTVS